MGVIEKLFSTIDHDDTHGIDFNEFCKALTIDAWGAVQHGRDEILCSSMSDFAVSVLCERALRGAHLRACCAVRVDVWRCDVD